MKTKLLYRCLMAFAFLVFISKPICAQQILSSSGSTGQNISGTLGELVIETKTNGSETLTQGFHQSQIIVTAVSEIVDSGFSISVYPNPTNDFVNLKIKKGETRDMEFILFDIQGKILLKQKLTDTEESVSFVPFNPGTYFIKILKNSKELQTFKIIKTQP